MSYNQKISIVLINWYTEKDTIECLRSLYNLEYTNYEIIIIDNGSKTDLIEKEKNKKIIYIKTNKNLGFSKACNTAINIALTNNSDYIFLLNNDTIVEKNILTHFLKAFECDKNIGIVGGKIFHYDNKTKLHHLGGIWDANLAQFTDVNKIDDDKNNLLEVDYISGCALFIKKEVIKKIGLFDERFFLIWEDSDFCYRAKKNNYKVVVTPNAHIWHKISSSFSGGKPHTEYYWWRNRLLWIEKHCSNEEKKNIYWKILKPEILKLLKFKLLKTLQYIFYPTKKRKLKLLYYKAAMQGLKDYLLKKFGKGPDWLEKYKID